MRPISLLWAAALTAFVVSGAFALDAAAPDPTQTKAEIKPNKAPASAATSAADPAVRSAKSIECSQKADAQNLHGKPRKHFMRECKRAD